MVSLFLEAPIYIYIFIHYIWILWVLIFGLRHKASQRGRSGRNAADRSAGRGAGDSAGGRAAQQAAKGGRVRSVRSEDLRKALEMFFPTCGQPNETSPKKWKWIVKQKLVGKVVVVVEE